MDADTILLPIQEFFDSQTGQLAIWVLLAPVLDFVLGVSAAVRDGTFRLDSVASFAQKHLVGRIFPIWLLLGVGYFTQNLTIPLANVPALSTVGLAVAAAYVVETFGSIMASWGPTSGPALITRDPEQPVPKE